MTRYTNNGEHCHKIHIFYIYIFYFKYIYIYFFMTIILIVRVSRHFFSEHGVNARESTAVKHKVTSITRS